MITDACTLLTHIHTSPPPPDPPTTNTPASPACSGYGRETASGWVSKRAVRVLRVRERALQSGAASWNKV